MLALFGSLVLALVPAAVRNGVPAGESGKVFLTVEEALALAFPACQVERETRYLSEAEAARVQQLAGVALETRVLRPYVARRAGQLVGTAYFDVHRVRTKNEVLLFVVAPDERLARLEVLSFAEPLEYLPKPAFYAQFMGKKLDEELDLKRAIHGVAGASLSARAATDAARRVLAVQRVLAERMEPAPPGAPAPK